LFSAAIVAFAIGAVGQLILQRRERPTFARLRRDLRDRSTFTIEPDELRDFEERLARADRVRERRPRAAFVLRLVGLALVAGVVVAGVVLRPDLVGWFALAAAVEAVAFSVAIIAAGARWRRLDAVLSMQRAEVAA